MQARYVRPYSKGQKNDFRDAEAIAEAVQRPTMKFVVTKTADQLDLAIRRSQAGRGRRRGDRRERDETGIELRSRVLRLSRGEPLRSHRSEAAGARGRAIVLIVEIAA